MKQGQVETVTITFMGDKTKLFHLKPSCAVQYAIILSHILLLLYYHHILRGGGLVQPPQIDFFLPIFLTMKMTFNLNTFWCRVRQYKVVFVKRVHDNTTKDKVTVTSWNICRNDGMIRILKILKCRPIFLTMKMRFNLNKFRHGVR